MLNRMRAVLTAPLAAALLVGSCASKHPVGDGPDRTPPHMWVCPNFELPSTGFDMTPQPGVAVLGPGSFIRWSQGAVSTTTHFTVAPVVTNDGKLAGIDITPHVDFEEAVLLRLTYGKCPQPGPNQGLFIAMRKAAADPWQAVTSRQSKSGQYVEAYIPGFSDWAIAD